VAALSLSNCTRKNTTIERVAVLPANLLMSDPAFEWLKVGVPIVLQHDLMTGHTLISGFAPDEAGAIQGGATRVLRTSVESRQGGLHIESTMVDAATHKVSKVESADASSVSVILPALNTLARKIDPSAIDFATKNQQAWQSFTTSQSSNNPQQRAQFLNQAISLDPGFGFAWVSLIEMIAPNRQTDLKNLIDEGKSHRNSFDPYDRARFDVAMNRLSNAAPADQIRSAQAVLGLAPNDLDVLTTLGNYQILAGNYSAGEQSLRHAVSLNPSNIGLRFQLARGLMQLRKFKESENIFTSIDKNPAVYPELATCILLEGDKPRATTVVERFVASVQNDELKSLLRGEWEVLSGDRQKGIDRVLATTFNTPRIHAMAVTNATIWQLMGGDFAGAQKSVEQLTQVSGPAVTLPELAALLADKTTPAADWQKKVQTVALPESVKEPILAYGFFLRGDFEQAAKTWQQVGDTNHGADLRARAMLASSLDHLGKKSDAQRIAVLPFTPEFADLYSAVAFTEMRRMLSR
jgi:hypothetical protein